MSRKYPIGSQFEEILARKLNLKIIWVYRLTILGKHGSKNRIPPIRRVV